MITDISADSALIQWTVPYIAYSPEMYVVKYGTSQDSLTENSDSTYSVEDTTITNKTYSIKLSNLKESSTYYVQVVATNTANRTDMSNVGRFTTLPLVEVESGIIIYISTLCVADETRMHSCINACAKENCSFTCLYCMLCVLHVLVLLACLCKRKPFLHLPVLLYLVRGKSLQQESSC